MKQKLIRTKLILGVLLLVLLTIGLSTLGVSYLVSIQNDEHGRNLVKKGLGVIKSTLENLKKKSLENVIHFVQEPVNIVNMEYLASIKGTQNMDVYKFIVDRPKEEMAASLKELIELQFFDGFYVYDVNNKLIIYLEKKNKLIRVGIDTFDIKGNSIFKYLYYVNGQESSSKWRTGELPHEIWAHENIISSPENKTQFRQVGQNVAITGLIPFISSEENEENKNNVIGKVFFYKILESNFVNELSNATEMHVNLFCDKILVYGTLPGFSSLNQNINYNIINNPNYLSQIFITSYEQTEYYQSFIPLFNLNECIGSLFLSFSREDTIRKTKENIYMLLLIAGICILITIPITIIMANKFSKRINDILDAVNKIIEGDLEVSVPVTMEDEVGRLAKAFNYMTSKLSELIHGMEDKVAERTSELETTNKKLIKAKEDADAATKAKSEFLANMSHEIRTPMNGIIASAELAMCEKMSPKIEKFLKMINSSGYSLLGIINDILDFSKIEAGKLEIELHNFNIDNIIDSVIGTCYNKAVEKEIELLIDLDPKIPISLIGDSLRIQQIIVNLVGNAFKFTDKGGAVIIGINSINNTSKKAELLFQVKDTGIGIAPDHQKKIFQSFSQVDASTTRKYGGTGLGLTICKQLVELMGGKIWMESEPNIGTTFYFSLILEKGDEKSENKYIVPANLQDINVLVVDDFEESLKITKKMLGYFNFQVKSVCSGKEALLYLSENHSSKKIDLIIMDMSMPELDGFETAKSIMENFNIKIPIIMFSPIGKDIETSLAESLGIRSFLNKPINSSMLFDAIIDIFSKKPAKIENTKRTIKTQIELYKERLKGTRILVAEDNITNQDIALAIFDGTEIIVEIAEDGKQALNIIKKKQFDLILMDIQMPEMDGYEATRAIRQWENNLGNKNKIPIIAMTANAMKGDDEKCLKAGMDGYIPKPIKVDKLYQTLWTFIKSKGDISKKENINNKTDKIEHKRDITTDKETIIKKLKGLRILVAEDNLTNQDIALAIFEGKGMFVEIAENGQQAFDAVKNKKFDVIFMDIHMPAMDGYETTKAIRQWEKQFDNKKKIPIIAMTANSDKEDREKCLNAGMDELISKPFQVDKLFQILWNTISELN